MTSGVSSDRLVGGSPKRLSPKAAMDRAQCLRRPPAAWHGRRAPTLDEPLATNSYALQEPEDEPSPNRTAAESNRYQRASRPPQNAVDSAIDGKGVLHRLDLWATRIGVTLFGVG